MAFDPTQYPYDTIVYITDTIGGLTFQASGVLISPDEVLTASHVVYNSVLGVASNIRVSAAYDSGTAPFGVAYGTFIHYFPVQDAGDSIALAQSQSDYAVIHLSTGFAGIGTMGLQANFNAGVANVTGYPGYLDGALDSSLQFVYRDPRYTLLDGTTIGAGSSGGPVWITDGSGNPRVVGVVSSGAAGWPYTGYFTQITTAAFNQIEAWVAQDDATPTPSTPTPASAPTDITAHGSHTQYEIARDPGTGHAVVVDTVAGRDGTHTVAALHDVVFTDGVGVFDATGNAEEAARLYRSALDRTPDATGLGYWTAQLDSGTLTIDGVALGFIKSPEFQAKYGTLDSKGFVDQLYANVLHRAPDASGEQYWIGQLNSGTGRAQALVGFSDSLENKLGTQGTIGDPHMDEAYRLYQAAFNRTPDRPGLGYWTGQLDSGVTALQMAQGFVGSAEFTQLFAGMGATAFVDTLYQNILHRAPDVSGAAYWIGQLNAGTSKAQVLLGFSDSLENRLNTSQATHDGWVYLSS